MLLGFGATTIAVAAVAVVGLALALFAVSRKRSAGRSRSRKQVPSAESVSEKLDGASKEGGAPSITRAGSKKLFHNPMKLEQAPSHPAAANTARPTAAAAGDSTMMMHKALPPGWYENVDPSSGNTYYFNDHGDTSWVRPTMSAV